MLGSAAEITGAASASLNTMIGNTGASAVSLAEVVGNPGANTAQSLYTRLGVPQVNASNSSLAVLMAVVVLLFRLAWVIQ